MNYLYLGDLAILASLILLAQCEPDAAFQAAVKAEPQSHNYTEPLPDQFSPRGLSGLVERQTGCYSPNRYCPLYGYCCSSASPACCPGGCILEVANECCRVGGGYCVGTKECCFDGCMPAGSDCCLDGGYCPSPYICVLYDGVIGCCTDLTCSVYLSSGIPKTVGYSTRAPLPSTAATTTSYITTTPYTTKIPTPKTTSNYTTGTESTTGYEPSAYYITWTTEIYWYYWYYYYTIVYYPATYTTRTITTVFRTTTVTYEATDSYDAFETYLSLSSLLPTPTDAETTIPESPTAGALIVGSCSAYITTTSTDTSYTSSCETITAGQSTTSRSTARSSAAATATSTTTNFSQLGAGNSVLQFLAWPLLTVVPASVTIILLFL